MAEFTKIIDKQVDSCFTGMVSSLLIKGKSILLQFRALPVLKKVLIILPIFIIPIGLFLFKLYTPDDLRNNIQYGDVSNVKERLIEKDLKDSLIKLFYEKSL